MVETKAPTLVPLDPAHQALIDRILKLHQDGLNSRQIADHLNERGVSSWGGMRFYPELVFGVIRKARIKSMATSPQHSSTFETPTSEQLRPRSTESSLKNRFSSRPHCKSAI